MRVRFWVILDDSGVILVFRASHENQSQGSVKEKIRTFQNGADDLVETLEIPLRFLI